MTSSKPRPDRIAGRRWVSTAPVAPSKGGWDMTPTPRTLTYAERLQAVEQRVVDALPEIIDSLMPERSG